MSSEYVSREEFDRLRDITANGIERTRDIVQSVADQFVERSASKAHLINRGPSSDPLAWTSDDGPSFFHALWQARSTDHDVQREGKRRLEELGSRYLDGARPRPRWATPTPPAATSSPTPSSATSSASRDSRTRFARS